MQTCVSKAQSTQYRRVFLLFEDLGEIATFETKVFDALAARQRAPTRHVFFIRGAHKIENDLCLVEVAVSREYRLSLEHLTKDTSADC